MLIAVCLTVRHIKRVAHTALPAQFICILLVINTLGVLIKNEKYNCLVSPFGCSNCLERIWKSTTAGIFHLALDN